VDPRGHRPNRILAMRARWRRDHDRVNLRVGENFIRGGIGAYVEASRKPFQILAVAIE
jgi:hypothetical protein